MTRRFIAGCVFLGVLATFGGLLPCAARAESMQVTSIGPRVGFGIGPDQVVFGGHMVVGGFDPNWTFSPILELGIGDHQTVVSVSFDAYYHFRLTDTNWRPYLGGGINISNFNYDASPPFPHDSSTDAGVNFVMGTSIPTASQAPMFAELRLGLGDIPDLRGMFGWNFNLGR